jgi:hypothetical protein
VVRADKARLLSTSRSKNRGMMTTDIVEGPNIPTLITTYHKFHISQSAIFNPPCGSQKSGRKENK